MDQTSMKQQGLLNVSAQETSAPLEVSKEQKQRVEAALDDAATPGDAVACLAYELSGETARPVTIEAAEGGFRLRL